MPRPAPSVTLPVPDNRGVPGLPQASCASLQRGGAALGRPQAMARALPLLGLLFTGAPQASERLTGTGDLRRDRQHRNDGRFSMTATPRAGGTPQRHGGCELIARMPAGAEAKTNAAACSAGGAIFWDVFE